MQSLTATPLLVAQLFSYAPHPDDHAPLRRALGAQAGVEGFAAAAKWQRVPHLVLVAADEDGDSGQVEQRFSRYVPVGAPHSTRDDVDTVVLYDRDHVQELRRLCGDDGQYVPRQCQMLVVHLASSSTDASTTQTHLAVGKCNPSSLVIPADALSKQRVREEWALQHCFLEERDSLTSVDLRGLQGLHEIGHMFLKQCKNLTQVNLSSFTGVTSIGGYFLAECPALTSVDLSAFTEVSIIGPSFLAGCSALTTLDLRPLSKLDGVGDEFAARCVSLTSTDLSAQENLLLIAEKFFDGCTRLEFVNMSSFVGLVHWNYACNAAPEFVAEGGVDREAIAKASVDALDELEGEARESGSSDFVPAAGTWNLRSLRGFCARTGLRRLDLSALHMLTAIGNDIVQECRLLEVVTISRMSNLHTIGSRLARDCPALVSASFADLPSLTSMGDSVLENCSALERITMARLPALRTVGEFFACSCSSLTVLDVCDASALEEFGDGTFASCKSLKSIDLRMFPGLINLWMLAGYSGLMTLDATPLTSLTRIGDELAVECEALSTISLAGLDTLTSIGLSCAAGCEALTSVDLSGLCRLREIEECFLSSCTSLTALDLSDLTSLKHVGHHFLFECTALVSVNLSGLAALETVDHGFMRECRSLKSIDLSGLKKLRSIGAWFMAENSGLRRIDVSPLVPTVETVLEGFLKDCKGLESVEGVGREAEDSAVARAVRVSGHATEVSGQEQTESAKRHRAESP